MMPFVSQPPKGSNLPMIKDNRSLWEVVEKRFGPDGKVRVQMAFRQAWLNESDFDRIHTAGLNCVRLPFLAERLEEKDGFRPLDDAIQWAGNHGIYVILDMHGAPGSQSDQGHTGVADRTEFFKDAANIIRAEALWKTNCTALPR